MGRASNEFALNPFPEPDPRKSAMALEKLISAQDLSVVFQPILRVSTMDVFAYEALVRCSVPDYRNPMELFKRAVADGCCGRLGRMIREISAPLCDEIPLFVNVHPGELEERWLIQPDDPIFRHNAATYIELTEAVPLARFELCRNVLTEIRRRGGAHLVVDDLGAGYSNLKYIADLEPSIVKIDRALIAGARRGSRHQQLIAGIVKLCADLDAQVVAEGIETREEFDVAVAAGVTFVQGYLFARPAFPLPLQDRIESPEAFARSSRSLPAHRK